MERFEVGFAEWVVRTRWWIIAATVLFVLWAVSGMRFITFNNDNRIFFSEKNPQLEAFEALENTYTKDNNVLFVIAPKNGTVFTRETLKAIEELTEASWKVPFSSRVDSITNFQHTWAEKDDLIVEDLVENADNLSDADIARIKNIALSEPLLFNRLISKSGHVSSINVNLLLPGKTLDEPQQVAAYARKMVKDIQTKYPDIDIHLIGGVMFDTAFAEASQKDMGTVIPAMYLVLLIITGVSLRSFAGTFATLVIILISMLTGLGIAGWLGFDINVASVNAPTIIMTLAVADSIHILVTMFHQMHQGKTRREAITESVRVNLQPIFLTSLTTAIGFLTMNFSDAPPFADLGNMVAMGIVAAFVFSVTFLPAFMAVVPLRFKPRNEKKCSSCEWFSHFVINRKKEIFWGTLVVVIILTSGMRHIDLNDNFIKYFSKEFEIRQAADFVEENLTGLDIIEYSLESGEAGGINDPAYLEKLEEFANWYRKEPKVVHVNVLTDIIKRLNKNMHGDDDAFYRLPEERELAAQYLLLYEMSVPFGLDLNNQINVDKSSTRMQVTIRDTTTKEQRALEERGREWLSKNAPETMFTHGTGITMIWAHLSERNINSMLGASFGALVLISGILIVALKSLRLGLVSLVPNLAPAFMAFGIWGFTVGQIGIGLSIMVALTLGIVVDDTVHFMSKYLRGRREHSMDPPEAVHYAFNTVGTALWVTTLALVAGFLVLTLSGYKMNSDMGLLTAITISLALLLDFLFLPTLLMIVDKEESEPSETYEPVPA